MHEEKAIDRICYYATFVSQYKMNATNIFCVYHHYYIIWWDSFEDIIIFILNMFDIY